VRRLFPLALILCIVFITGCNTVGQNKVGIENFAQVSADLYRGAQPTEAGLKTLKSYNIKTIINLRDANPVEAAMCKNAGFVYISMPHNAEQSTPADAETFLAALADAPRPAFVHCHAGRDRTGLVVAAYRMRLQGWSAKAALSDLYTHGHHWFLYPKVKASILALALSRTTELAAAKPLEAALPAKN
jgi:protein tyrosine phosphatase (PTP) superfamily phosphohydrolase (DUF442 family)